jgi:hypothetical protein
LAQRAAPLTEETKARMKELDEKRRKELQPLVEKYEKLKAIKARRLLNAS